MPLPFNRNIKILYEIAFNIDIAIFTEHCCRSETEKTEISPRICQCNQKKSNAMIESVIFVGYFNQLWPPKHRLKWCILRGSASLWVDLSLAHSFFIFVSLSFRPAVLIFSLYWFIFVFHVSSGFRYHQFIVYSFFFSCIIFNCTGEISIWYLNQTYNLPNFFFSGCWSCCYCLQTKFDENE